MFACSWLLPRIGGWRLNRLFTPNDQTNPPSVSNDEAKQKYPGGWKTLKSYLRIIPQPK